MWLPHDHTHVLVKGHYISFKISPPYLHSPRNLQWSRKVEQALALGTCLSPSHIAFTPETDREMNMTLVGSIKVFSGNFARIDRKVIFFLPSTGALGGAKVKAAWVQLYYSTEKASLNIQERAEPRTRGSSHSISADAGQKGSCTTGANDSPSFLFL